MDNHIEELIEFKERSKSNSKRLDEHDARLDKLEKTYSIMEKMDYRMGKVENAVDKINIKLDTNAQEKGKKWDKLVDYLFYAFIAVMLGLLYTKLGI
jgi:hypothetical protein